VLGPRWLAGGCLGGHTTGGGTQWGGRVGETRPRERALGGAPPQMASREGPVPTRGACLSDVPEKAGSAVVNS